MSRRAKKKTCDPRQLRSPQTHNCKLCTSFSIEDLKEFYETLLNKQPNQTWDKKQICEEIRKQYEPVKLDHIDKTLNELRTFIPSITLISEKVLLPENIENDLNQHLIADQKYGTKGDALNSIEKQMSYIVDILTRNNMFLLYLSDEDGNYHIMDEFKDYITSQKSMPMSGAFSIYFRQYYLGSISFKIVTLESNQLPKEPGKKSFLSVINDKIGKTSYRAYMEYGGVFLYNTKFKSFFEAQKNLNIWINEWYKNHNESIYFYNNKKYEKIPEELIDLYMKENELLTTDTTWYVTENNNCLPFNFGISVVPAAKIDDQTQSEAKQFFKDMRLKEKQQNQPVSMMEQQLPLQQKMQQEMHQKLLQQRKSPFGE